MNQRFLKTGFLAIACWLMAEASPFVFGESPTISETVPMESQTLEVQVRIRPGDTLWAIARKYRTTIKALAQLNRIKNPHAIRVGMLLSIPKQLTTQTGKDGISSRTERLITSRSRVRKSWASEGLMEVRPSEEVTEGNMEPCISRPMAGGVFTSGFGYRWGRMHRGIDWSCPTGTPVFAAAPGIVSFAGWRSGYGWMVEVDHGEFRTRYAHNSRIMVRLGEGVRTGDLVSLAGSTGRTTGPHLHFELIYRGMHVNPMKYFANDGENLRDY